VRGRERRAVRPARGARVTEAPGQQGRVHPDRDRPQDGEQGERLSFLAMSGLGSTTTVRVTWTGPDGTERNKDWRLAGGVASPA
jgi:hypothetical protein